MAKANIKYNVLWAWWLSSTSTIEEGMYGLSKQLEF